MKKTILAAGLVLILVLAACAASDNNDTVYDPKQADASGYAAAQNLDNGADEAVQDENDDPDPILPDASIPEGFTFTTQGVTIHMDQNMAEVLEQLGEPLGVFEAPSCAFDGIDRIFSFPGVQIHTYPDGDLDFVHTISIRDDSVTTMNGIFLGSSWEDVLAAYGDVYQQEFGMFTFTMGRTTLSFFIEDEMVVGITYELIMG